MSAKYEKNVYLAMLAEQCRRFKEMVEFLEDMVKQRDKDLNSDERNLLSIAYKNSISGARSAVRTIMAYEAKEKKKENSTFLLIYSSISVFNSSFEYVKGKKLGP